VKKNEKKKILKHFSNSGIELNQEISKDGVNK